MSRLSSPFEFFRIVAIVLVTAVVIRYFIFQPFVVEGSSMEPNYHNGEYLFIEKISYRARQPHRGEVVVFRYPNDTSVNYIKRIIGLPGETIRIENGRVSLNGSPLIEDYLAPGTETLVNRAPEVPYEITIPTGKYFVMGDNRQHSSDSRDGWTIGESLIIGRSAATLYPASYQKPAPATY